jgi:hypothetical protein
VNEPCHLNRCDAIGAGMKVYAECVKPHRVIDCWVLFDEQINSLGRQVKSKSFYITPCRLCGIYKVSRIRAINKQVFWTEWDVVSFCVKTAIAVEAI